MALHFMICCFAVLIACVPLMTIKGSTEHKFAGLVYLPVSLCALLLASFMAWREASAVLVLLQLLLRLSADERLARGP